MVERDAFIRAICETPEDDGPRLVYADWLDEHGDLERAEFVRLQCALDAGDPFAPGRRALLRREWNLLRQHGERWIREDGLADFVAPDSLWHYPPKTRFRRGFVDRAWFLSPDDCVRDAPALFALAPITGIALWSAYAVPQDQQTWFQNTYLAIFCRENGLPPQPPREPGGTAFPEPAELRRFVHSPTFARLTAFAMNSLYTDRQHLEILAAAPAGPHLRKLDLSGNTCVVGDAWSALTQSPAVAELRLLRLDGCHLGIAGVRAVATSPHLGRVERLSLEADALRREVGAEGVRAICESTALPRLRELNLHGQGGGEGGLRALAAWPGLARLTRLDISHFYADADEFADLRPAWGAFVRSPHWGALRELNLEGGSLADLEAFLDGPNVATLRVLTFAYEFRRYEDERTLQDEAAALLARCPHFADDLELQFPGEGLTKAGRRTLRDRFGDGLILYSADGGRHRQPGDWASGRPSRSTFRSEERRPDRPPRSGRP